MLLLHILTASVLATVESQTIKSYVKRSPNSTSTASVESLSASPELNNNAQEDSETLRTANLGSKSPKPRLTSSSNLAPLEPEAVSFKWSRILSNVNELWQEYKYGIDGNPSLESLLEKYGTSWITSRASKIRYTYRKQVFDFILKEIASGKSENEAVNDLDYFRFQQGWDMRTMLMDFHFVTIDPASGEIVYKPKALLWRNLTTVPQVWQEYKYGIYGRPSVEKMEHTSKALYLLHSSVEKPFYNSRNDLYNLIKTALKNGHPEQDSVNQLEQLRLEKKWTLKELQQNIVAIAVGNKDKEIPTKQYKLTKRNLTTIPELWQEYKYGYYGTPSLDSIVQEDGPIPSNVGDYYSTRKNIYDYIKTSINNGTPEEDAVNYLEQMRLDNEWTLGELQQNLPSFSIEKDNVHQVPTKSVKFKLRNLTTVPELWQEYHYGLYGNPSIESVVQENRTGRSILVGIGSYYSTRKNIYDAIKTAINNGTPEEDAVNNLEQTRLDNKWTLSALQLNLPTFAVDQKIGQESSNDQTS